ncbi:MAG: transketolase [Pseudomonadota bacterium]
MTVNLEKLCANTIRMLAVDAVERANSGHPGLPMGAADYTFVLWNRFLRYSASDPKWPNRDRFVLSAGHGSMLLYALLHLAGFGVTLEDLKSFRQWESRTPGHPESFRTPGVEATTGPLGQGIGNAVGMTIAAKMMAARFNRPDFAPVDHRIYALAGDGDMMEGVSGEAASLAGHLGLENLTVLYDDNRITIDGSTDLAFSEDVAKRFEAYGWGTRRIDGHDRAQIAAALEEACAETGRPQLILARTHIGFGSPHRVDTSKAHGTPLGKEEVEATKKALGWPLEPLFLVPEEVRGVFRARTLEVEGLRGKWEQGFAAWRAKYPDLAEEWDAVAARKVDPNLAAEFLKNLPPMPDATRNISGKLQQLVARACPSLVGGAADLNESTKTEILGSGTIRKGDFAGRNLAFGIREHAMGSILNGLALYGGWVPFGSTFLAFSDYMRPSIRLAALSRLAAIYVFTHDSVFLGEDGPTHQAVEQLGALRLIPNLHVIRPADSLECAAAWLLALRRSEGPSVICLTRQKLAAIERPGSLRFEEPLRGGYVVWGERVRKPAAILAATGSELHLAMGAARELGSRGFDVRVVSLLCAEEFDRQPEEYRREIFPPSIPTVAVEAGRSAFWYRYVGREGLILGIDRFGESAPDNVLAEKFGFTVPAVTARILDWLKQKRTKD